jgi:hypothetical protein
MLLLIENEVDWLLGQTATHLRLDKHSSFAFEIGHQSQSDNPESDVRHSEPPASIF